MEKRFLLAFASATVLATGMASAQEQDDEAEARTLDTITVTAQRVEQNIQDVPIALSAIAGDDLIAAGVSDPTTLGDVVPNLAIVRNNGGIQITIRGVTSTDLTEKGDPSTAFLADGVFIARPQAQEVSFFDLERVEVLRGPQGTLYGRNTTAGVINLISARPTDEFGGSLDVAYGNFDTIQATGVLNVPVNENLAFRGAVNYDRRDNFVIDAADDGFSLNPFKENISGRLSALFTLGDTFDLIVRGDYSDIGGIANVNLPITNFFSGAPAAAGDVLRVNEGSSSDRRTTDFNEFQQASRNNDTWGVMAEANWDIGPGTLTYLGSYRELERDETASAILLPANAVFPGFPAANTSVIGANFAGEFEQNSQELRYAYGEGGPLFIQGGLYYFREESDILASLPDPLGILGIAPANELAFSQDPTIAESIGVFGQATYNITEDLSFTGGVRWTQDDKSRVGNTLITIPGGIIPGVDDPLEMAVAINDADVRFDEVTWRVGVDYDTQWGLLYASVSTGYKAGGFNDGCVIGTQPGCDQAEETLFYNPEELLAYEVGAKLDFLDGRVRVNASGFFYDYEDLQVNTLGSVGGAPATLILNAAEATIFGLELDSQVQIDDRNSLVFGLTLLEAEYDEFEPLPGIDFNGRDLDRAANVTLAAAYTFTQPLPNGADLEFTAKTKFTDDFLITDQTAAVQFEQTSVTKSGVSLTYTSPDARWYLQGYGDNLENEVVVQNASTQFGGSVSAIGDPRTYGVRLGVNF